MTLPHLSASRVPSQLQPKIFCALGEFPLYSKKKTFLVRQRKPLPRSISVFASQLIQDGPLLLALRLASHKRVKCSDRNPHQSRDPLTATATQSNSTSSSSSRIVTAADATRTPAKAHSADQINPPLALETSQPAQPASTSRSLKQLGLFFAGAGFLTASIMVSRRAAIRHYRSSQLKHFVPNHKPGKAGDTNERRDPMVAVEALNLATLNVVSFGIMATGGAAWAFDISSVDELREKTRRSLYGTEGGSDEDAERGSR